MNWRVINGWALRDSMSTLSAAFLTSLSWSSLSVTDNKCRFIGLGSGSSKKRTKAFRGEHVRVSRQQFTPSALHCLLRNRVAPRCLVARGERNLLDFFGKNQLAANLLARMRGTHPAAI